MVDCITVTTSVRTWETAEKGFPVKGKNFFSDKIQKKSDFILNSGNSYVTLQLELCLYVS